MHGLKLWLMPAFIAHTGSKNMNIFVKMFDDKLVIESPGGFPPLVTPENIYDSHNPRNPTLMRAMFYMGLVKEHAEGTKRMRVF